MSATGIIMTKHLREERWSILAWVIVTVLITVLVVGIFPTFSAAFDMLAFFERVPDFMKSMIFGDRPMPEDPLSTFLVVKYFAWQGVGLGFFACIFASGVSAKEMEKKTLEGLLALPIRRDAVIFGKLLACVVAIAAILLSMYLALYLSLLAFVDTDVYLDRYAYIFINVFFLLLAVASYAFLLSCLIDDQRRAIVVSVGIMLIMFVADLMLDLSATLRGWQVLSLFCYFRAGAPLETGRMPWTDAAILAAFTVILTAATLIVFRRKQISG